jgi:hypothetical protein
MAENKELARGPRLTRCVSDAQNITAMPLRDSFHAHALFFPFRGNDPATAVSGSLFETRRFDGHKPSQRRKHLRQPPPEGEQELPREIDIPHGSEMLSTRRDQGNQVKVIAVS